MQAGELQRRPLLGTIHVENNTSKTPLGRIATKGTLVTQRDATVTQRDGSVTLLRRRVARLPYLQISSDQTDVEIELSVLRTPRKHYILPPPMAAGGEPLRA